MDGSNINSKKFTCPACKELHVIGNCERVIPKPQPVIPSADETQYNTTGREETQYAGSGYNKNPEETSFYAAPQPTIGVFVDNSGRTYQLQIGINTIGRKAMTSSATIQIMSDDRTMSRSHAVVEVRNAGGQIIHILKNGANKNPSYHNGILIGASDQLILNNGDRVKFGNTELTFKK